MTKTWLTHEGKGVVRAGVTRQIAVLACALFALASAGAASAATFFQYSGQPHELVTQGTSATLSTPAVTFATNINATSDQLSVSMSGGSSANLLITAASGQTLTAGLHQLGAPLGLADVIASFNGGSCQNMTGSLFIGEISINSTTQTITAFAADFIGHCFSEDEELAFGIRINSALPYTNPPLSYAGPAIFQYSSQTGDFVGQGATVSLTRADGTFEPGAAATNALGVNFSDFANPGIFWETMFQAANGAVLAPNGYAAAQRWPFETAGHPALQVFGDGRGCNTLTGSFSVLDVQVDAYGVPTVLAVDFVQHCEGQGPVLTGALRFNSALAYNPVPPPPVPVGIGSLDGVAFPVPAGGTQAGPRVKVVDSNGSPSVGVTVEFTTLGCGTISGGSPLDLVTDGSGMVQAPSFSVPAGISTTCYMVATVVGAGIAPLNLAYFGYLPAEVSVTLYPGSNLEVALNRTFTVGAHVSLRGSPLANAPVTFAVVAGTAAPVSLGTSATTDATGVGSVQGVAGATEGSFTVQVTVAGILQVATVTQLVTPTTPVSTPPLLGTIKDMWWNPGENGWGMSLIEHDTTLFGAFFIYDATGAPMWVVMPSGSWDAAHTIYTGTLYQPTGSPFFAYNPSSFSAGDPLGSVSITFEDANNAIIDYSLPAGSGRKYVTREIFATGPEVAPDHADLWWGGVSQNGWGITVMQQAHTLFAVWYTYDANGAARWYVMPGGAWTSSDTYEGALYRTTGSAWAGKAYDPTKLQVIDAGTFKFQFNGDSATFTYSADGHGGTIPLVKEPF